MISDGNPVLHNGIKSNQNGKYVSKYNFKIPQMTTGCLKQQKCKNKGFWCYQQHMTTIAQRLRSKENIGVPL